MAVSILWALTAEEQPDFFRAPTLPVCWLLVPFSKFFYLEHLSRFPKGSWDLRKKDPRRSNDMFALLCVYLGQQDGRWEMESQPQPTERVPCFLVKSTKAVLVLYMFASHGPYQVDEWKMCVENLHWEVCWWERCVDGGWESRSLKSYLIFFLSTPPSLFPPPPWVLLTIIINTIMPLFVLFLPPLFYLANSYAIF